jgi:hypothetical protein
VILRTLLVALAGSVAATSAIAQDAPSGTRVWGAVGVGAGVPSSGGDGIGNMAQLVIQKNAHHAAVRGLVLHDIERSTREIGELGALYGRTSPFSWGRATVAAGVSAVAFDTCPDDDDSCFTAGVPILVELARSNSAIGVGIQAFGNLNAKASYAGAVLFLQLGRLR